MLTPAARARFSSGKTYTLVSSDAETLYMLCQVRLLADTVFLAQLVPLPLCDLFSCETICTMHKTGVPFSSGALWHPMPFSCSWLLQACGERPWQDHRRARIARLSLPVLCAQGLFGFVSSPLRITVAMVLLFRQLGPSSLVAVAAILVVIPVNAVLVRKSALRLKRSLVHTDERTKLEGELMAGVWVVVWQ